MWFAPCMFLLVSAFIFNQCFSNGNRLSWWMSRSYVYALICAHSTHLPIFLCSPSLLKHSNTEYICVYFVRDKKEKKTHTWTTTKNRSKSRGSKISRKCVRELRTKRKKNSTQAIASTSIKYYDHNSNLLICLVNGTEIRRNNTIRILRWAP